MKGEDQTCNLRTSVSNSEVFSMANARFDVRSCRPPLQDYRSYDSTNHDGGQVSDNPTLSKACEEAMSFPPSTECGEDATPRCRDQVNCLGTAAPTLS